MTLASPAVEVRGLVKRYEAVTAVAGLDFTIAANSTTGLLGGNGAGKTTLIGMLLGLVRPSAGRIRIFGLDMPRDREAILARANFESPYVDLPRRLTVRQNLEVYGRLYGVRTLTARIASIAAALDLEDLLDRPVGELSAGQRTRVSLAKAVVNEPDLLLLDEPTASLDPDTGDWVRRFFERYRERTGATILLASHNMAEVERLCDCVLMMKTGRIVDEGSPQDLLARYGRETLEDVFLDMARGRGRKTDWPHTDDPASPNESVLP